MGDNIYLLIFYAVIFIFILITFFLIVYIRNQNLMWQQRKDFQAIEILQQRQLLSAVIESQEIERKRIGEDLHDEIGGTLSAIKLMLNAAKKNTNDDEILVSAKQLIDKMIIDVRNIAHDLSPPGLAMFGLYHTIDNFASVINKTGEIELVINHEPFVESRFLQEQVELALFRVITQLIANTLKHAKATQINLIFKPNGENLSIEYFDNGKGFDLSILEEQHGIGMQNIKSRLQMIDAKYTLESKPDSGFKMNIDCPTNQISI
ncbi:MAG: sensor histidine kinase [Bacteroidia bacterium]